MQYALQIYVAFAAQLCYIIKEVKKVEDREAELYKAMYYKLFNAITDAMAMPVSLLRNEMLRQA